MPEWIGPIPAGDEIPPEGREDEIGPEGGCPDCGGDGELKGDLMSEAEVREIIEDLKAEVEHLGEDFGGIQREMDGWIMLKMSLVNALLADLPDLQLDDAARHGGRATSRQKGSLAQWYEKYTRAMNLNERILCRCRDLGLIGPEFGPEGQYELTPYGERIIEGDKPPLGAPNPLLPDGVTPTLPPAGGGYRCPPVENPPAPVDPDDPPATGTATPDDPPYVEPMPPVGGGSRIPPEGSPPPPAEPVPVPARPGTATPPPLKGVPLRLPKRIPEPGEVLHPPPVVEGTRGEAD